MIDYRHSMQIDSFPCHSLFYVVYCTANPFWVQGGSHWCAEDAGAEDGVMGSPSVLGEGK